MKKRYVSLEEANLLIPIAQRQMAKLLKLNQMLNIMESIDIIYENDYEYFEADMKKNSAIYKLSSDFYNIIEEMFKMGFLVKDAELGLVDVHSIHEGRPIYLVWQATDDRIMFWRELDDEYSAKQPISLLKKEERKK